MRFQVPQFIEVEDKIFGPLTLKQFIYVAGGAGICVTLWVFLPFFFALLIGIPVAIFSLLLAFYRMNKQPFIVIAEAWLLYMLKSKLYVWRKDENNPIVTQKGDDMEEESLLYVPKTSASNLKDLSWTLSVQGNQNPINPDDTDTEDSRLPNEIQTMQRDIERLQPKK
ncbi:MAG: PrgI family protein [Candidatus Paceibacterota bacterium]|jgi:hypothetical protein